MQQQCRFFVKKTQMVKTQTLHDDDDDDKKFRVKRSHEKLKYDGDDDDEHIVQDLHNDNSPI